MLQGYQPSSHLVMKKCIRLSRPRHDSHRLSLTSADHLMFVFTRVYLMPSACVSV